MLFHHRDLAYTVRVDKPNPVFGGCCSRRSAVPKARSA